MTIEAMLISGAVIGLLIGLLSPSGRVGCIILWIVPIGMIAYIAFWQWQHPENLRSTSALDYMFGPLWPSLGAGAGYVAGGGLRFLVHRLKETGR
ncbi:hypothetical protein QP166_09595 [Sphingomonas sp. LR60]|uniref:hypothetical protein n=1 Tax=Sphingomonas sp. LR60 TaxID=3050233 RepID=UPI002FE07891